MEEKKKENKQQQRIDRKLHSKSIFIRWMALMLLPHPPNWHHIFLCTQVIFLPYATMNAAAVFLRKTNIIFILSKFRENFGVFGLS